ncbi:hypothetical protein DYB30_010053, partial [Aphanomyces astaci]
RGQIAVWKADGKSVMFMSKSLGKSWKATSNYLKDPVKYGKRFKGGRPSKLNEYDLRRLFREATKSGMSSTKIVSTLELPISSRSVREKLSSNMIFNYVKRKCHAVPHR